MDLLNFVYFTVLKMPEVTISSPDALKNFPSSPDAGKTSTLIVKSTVVDPTSLLACLTKCADSLEILRLEGISLPGKEKFKKRVTLPKLKSFYYSQVKLNIDNKEALEDYLENLDAKSLIFFDKKGKDWELEQIWELKTNITLVIDGWRILDVNQDDLALTSMLPQSDNIMANTPKELTRLALYDVEINDESHIPTSDLTQLTLYEVIFPDIPAVLKQCQQLELLSIYEEKDEEEGKGDKGGKGGKGDQDDDEDDFDDEEGEEEEEDGDVDDWNNIELGELGTKSLKSLALGRARLGAKVKGATTLELDGLCLENCKGDQESLKLLKSKRVFMRNCDPAPTATILKRMTDAGATEFVMMNGFNWEAKDTNKKKMNELLKGSSASGELYSGEEKFLLEKPGGGGKWKGRKFEEDECLEQQFKMFNWREFLDEGDWKKIFE